MKLKSLFAAALLVVGAPAMAVPIETTFNLGSVSVPGLAIFGNSFSDDGQYIDHYNFSIGPSATIDGLVIEFDSSTNYLDLNVTGVQLLSGSTVIGSDSSASSFSFFNLAGSSSYTLNIFSSVSNAALRRPTYDDVGYLGIMTLVKGKGPTNSVPEPGTLALFGAGLVGVALAMRRRTLRN